MRVNFFEGARRIAYLIAGLWAVGVLVVIWNDEPTVKISYFVTGPGQSPIRSPVDAAVEPKKEGSVLRLSDLDDEPKSWADIILECEDHDAEESRYVKTPKGTSVSLSFCFKASEADNGKILVPYKVDSKTKMWWLAEKYSSQILGYTKQVVSQFRIPKADSDWADGQWWPARAKQFWEGAKWLFGGWFVLWLFAITTGWIVRGFAGIPIGQDEKPVGKQEE